MAKQGVLAVISGFSGAGKGTVVKALTERYDNYSLSVSATTRKPRPGEEHGREYFFVSGDEFERMIADDALIEYACYVSHYYGTPRAYVEAQMAAGKDVILEIEIQGALNIRKKFPEAVLIFVVPPTVKELRRRLLGRGTETPEVVEKRLVRAAEESDGMDLYDYIVVNDTVEECAERIHAIIRSQHERTAANRDLIARMKRELREINE